MDRSEQILMISEWEYVPKITPFPQAGPLLLGQGWSYLALADSSPALLKLCLYN